MKRIFTKINIIHRIMVLGIFCFVFSTSLQAQAVGDYGVNVSGNSSNLATWKTWDGTAWVAATNFPTSTNNGRILAGATLTIDAALSFGTMQIFGTNSSITVNNGVTTSFGLVTLAASGINTVITNNGTFNATALTISNPTSGTNTVTNTGTMTITGITNIGSGTNTGAVLYDNYGILNQSAAAMVVGTTTVGVIATFNNRSGATLARTTNGFTLNANSTLINNGTISKNGGGAFTLNGIISGTGTWNGSNSPNFTIGTIGTLSPGNSAGKMNFGNTTSNTFTNNGTINIEIGGTTAGTGFDQIVSTGLSVVNGNINVSFINGFQPTLNQQFIIVDGNATASGTPTVNVPAGFTATYTATGGDGILTFTGVIPVELAYFEVKNTKNTSLLTWRTESEKNNAYFEVQHTTNGTDFNTIAEVKGQGTTSQYTNYTYLHSTPSVGVNYYRLKQIDYDGKYTYSPIRVISFNNSEVSIKTNIVEETLEVNSNENITTTISIFNITGQQLLSAKIKGTANINISALPAGLYILKSSSGNVLRFTKG